MPDDTRCPPRRPGRRPSHPRGGARPTRSLGPACLAGTTTLIGLAARRELAPTIAWGALLAALLAGTTRSFHDVMSDPLALAAYNTSMKASPVQRFFNGPGVSGGAHIDDLGGVVVFEMGGYLLLLVAVLSLLTAVRHTRALEADGGAELLGAGRLGRLAPESAAFAVAGGQAVLWGAVSAVAMRAAGLPWGGCAAYGACLALTGTLLAAGALVAAQLYEQPGSATGASGLVLLAAFLIRGAADMDHPAARWASPLSWAQAIRPFDHPDAGPLVLGCVAVPVLLGVAAALRGRRDVGVGIWGPRPGPARATRFLTTPTGLIASQLRGALIGWGLVMVALGLVMGVVSAEVEASRDQLESAAVMLSKQDLNVLGVMRFAVSLLAVLAVACGVALLGRLSREETSGRLEAVLARPVGRVAWHLRSCAAVMGAVTALLVLAGVGLGAGAGLSEATYDRGDLVRLVAAQVPAEGLADGALAAFAAASALCVVTAGWLMRRRDISAQ